MTELIALLQVVAMVDKLLFFLVGIAIGLWVGFTFSK